MSRAVASHRVPEATFIQADQRELEGVGGPFDAVLVLWQSFGYFDPATNDAVLAGMASLLRLSGRLLLDLYHPSYWLNHQGLRIAPRVGVDSIEDSIADGRLLSTITYSDGSAEEMSFELFDPDVLVTRAEAYGLEVVDQCCWWDPARPPDASVARYQSVFEAV